MHIQSKTLADMVEVRTKQFEIQPPSLVVKKPQKPPVQTLNFSQLYTRKSKSYDGQGGQADIKKELAKKDKAATKAPKPQKVENDYLPVQVRSLNLGKNKSFSFGKTANPYNSATQKRESDICGMNFNHPNNMIYQAHSEQRNWMIKRGKAHQIYYNNDQIQKLRQYFEQMAGEEDHISVEQVREVLYSFGIVLSNEEVDKLVGNEKSFHFEEFLNLLKHSFVKNPRGI